MPPKSSRSRTARRPQAAGALDAGLRLLARRAHSEREMGLKLGRRGYPADEVHRALERLRELGYLDDRSFAESHVRRRSAGLGPLALAAELASRGVERSIADGVLVRFGPEAQVGVATRLAERLYGRRRWAGYREMLDSVGPKLMRRGFSAGVVRAACRAVWVGTGAEAEA